MDVASNGLGALTLFVEDLDTVTAFYRDVLALDLVHQDDVSSVVDLGGTLVNLLKVGAAAELVAPAATAPVNATAQMVLSLFVEDVDAICADLHERGVTLLNGPVDRPWGKRTAAFTDPAGTIWELPTTYPQASTQQRAAPPERGGSLTVSVCSCGWPVRARV